MLPAFSGSLDILPGFRIIPETPLYDVWTRYESGWIIVCKEGEYFRNRFMNVSRWEPHHREFLHRVSRMADRSAWMGLMKESIGDKTLNGYEVMDVTFLEWSIPETIFLDRKIPALRFREYTEK